MCSRVEPDHSDECDDVLGKSAILTLFEQADQPGLGSIVLGVGNMIKSSVIISGLGRMKGCSMLYVVAVLLPPVAVLMAAGRPMQTLLNVCLTLLGWIPGIVHAVVVVNRHKTEQRADGSIEGNQETPPEADKAPEQEGTVLADGEARLNDSDGAVAASENEVQPIHKVAATYEGGHPTSTEKTRGDLVLWPDRVEMARGREVVFGIPLSDVVRCELQPAKWGLTRTVIGAEARAVQTQTNMAILSCFVGGFEYELRFHIHGAMSVPGEAKRAQEFRDALYTFRPQFADPQPAVTAQVDVAEQIAKLGKLREDGLVTEEEFSVKKAELLDRL